MKESVNIGPDEAVLSDFDGTLVETEEAKGQLFLEGVAKAETETGLNYPNKHNHAAGESTTDPMKKWVKAPAASSAERIKREDFLEIYLAHWNGEQTKLYKNPDNLKCFKGAPGLVQQFRPDRAALVSSNPTDRLKLALKTLDWIPFFGAVIGYDDPDVPRKKPDPSSYRVASQHLNYAPSDCVTIEDSLAGIQSAVSAGIGKVLLVHRSQDPISERLRAFVGEHREQVQVIASLKAITVQS